MQRGYTHIFLNYLDIQFSKEIPYASIRFCDRLLPVRHYAGFGLNNRDRGQQAAYKQKQEVI
jgi:hypothetical protein